jgi:transcriptional regulator of acetoin/glycerol metabolism
MAIEQAIERHDGNVSAAIRELGIGRTTLYRKPKHYGLRA